jgi:crotonobetainyl-CoA hydratase
MAMGGGFELALAADLIVAADTAVFALPEVTLGMLADSGGILRLPRRLPQPIAREMLLTGRRMGAEEAARWGLVNQVVAPGALMDTAQRLARQIAAAAPLAITALKQVLRATEALSVADGFRALRSGTLDAYQAMLQSDDAREGPRAFAEKRPPQWRAR